MKTMFSTPLKLTAGIIAGIILLFTACNNMFAPMQMTAPDAADGNVVISMGNIGRTLFPNTPVFSGYKLEFAKGAGQTSDPPDPVTFSGGSKSVTLPLGNWNITATGYVTIDGADAEAATGAASLNVTAGTNNLTIKLKGIITKTGTGVFSYDIDYSVIENVNSATLYIYNMNCLEEAAPVPVKKVDLEDNGTGSIANLAAGFYILRFELEKDNGKLVKTEVIHIYNNLTTKAEGPKYTFTADDLLWEATPKTIKITGVTLPGGLWGLDVSILNSSGEVVAYGAGGITSNTSTMLLLDVLTDEPWTGSGDFIIMFMHDPVSCYTYTGSGGPAVVYPITNNPKYTIEEHDTEIVIPFNQFKLVPIGLGGHELTITGLTGFNGQEVAVTIEEYEDTDGYWETIYIAHAQGTVASNQVKLLLAEGQNDIWGWQPAGTESHRITVTIDGISYFYTAGDELEDLFIYEWEDSYTNLPEFSFNGSGSTISFGDFREADFSGGGTDGAAITINGIESYYNGYEAYVTLGDSIYGSGTVTGGKLDAKFNYWNGSGSYQIRVNLVNYTTYDEVYFIYDSGAVYDFDTFGYTFSWSDFDEEIPSSAIVTITGIDGKYNSRPADVSVQYGYESYTGGGNVASGTLEAEIADWDGTGSYRVVLYIYGTYPDIFTYVYTGGSPLSGGISSAPLYDFYGDNLTLDFSDFVELVPQNATLTITGIGNEFDGAYSVVSLQSFLGNFSGGEYVADNSLEVGIAGWDGTGYYRVIVNFTVGSFPFTENYTYVYTGGTALAGGLNDAPMYEFDGENLTLDFSDFVEYIPSDTTITITGINDIELDGADAYLTLQDEFGNEYYGIGIVENESIIVEIGAWDGIGSFVFSVDIVGEDYYSYVYTGGAELIDFGIKTMWDLWDEEIKAGLLYDFDGNFELDWSDFRLTTDLPWS